jgi:hypothetical protein
MSDSNLIPTKEMSFSKVSDYVNKNLTMVVAIAIGFFIIVYVTIYLYKRFLKTSLKTVTMLTKPFKINENELTNLTDTVTLPQLYNGKEFSVSYWVYFDAEQFNSTHDPKFVLGRMPDKGSLASSNPIFYTLPDSNVMYVAIKTNKDTGTYTNLNDLHSLAERDPSPSDSYQFLKIPYVPLQRWVNIILVVDNNFIQLFVDGELRQVVDLSSVGYSYSNIIVGNTNGNFYTGGGGGFTSFKGYLSKVQMMNYAITIDHAKIIYKSGPLHRSVLSVLGLPLYGVRNPFYRIDEVAKVEEDI